jgi:hypothetical protein
MIVRQLASGWTVSGILTAASGQSYIEPSSPYAGVNISTFTPTGAVDGGETGAVVSTFASASGGRASWIERNTPHMPNTTNIDFRLGRDFTFADKYRLQFAADAFNLFNSTLVTAVNTTAYTYAAPGSGACVGHTNGCILPSPTFGSRFTTSGSLYGPRQLQMDVRFEF